MFDISFIELLVIFVVALLVLGPDKLPGAIRTAALWLGRAKRSFTKVKAEIEQQINADDIRRQLHNESILADIEQARKNADKLVKDTQKDLDTSRDGIKRAISSTPTSPASESSPTGSAVTQPAVPQSTVPRSTVPQPAVPVVTSSAEEGLPTGEQSWPSKDADAGTATAKDAGTAEHETNEEKPKAQDIYNSPPSGRVTVTGRKLVAAEKPLPANDSTGEQD